MAIISRAAEPYGARVVTLRLDNVQHPAGGYLGPDPGATSGKAGVGLAAGLGATAGIRRLCSYLAGRP